jgi:uncharacterized protein (TIGR02996 family)
MSERNALLAAVCADPDDDTPRLVFADWLDEHDEPERAEFIRLQIQSAKLPDGKRKAQLQSREEELLEAHTEEWTEPLREFEGSRTGDFYIFRRGFVEVIGSDGEIMAEEGDRVFELAPIREIKFADLEEYADLAKCKWFLRLNALDLKGSGLSHYFDPAPLIKSRYLANLKRLRLAGEDDNGHLDLKGVKALVAAKYLGNVEDLDLSGNWLNQFNSGTFAHFLTAKNLPALRKLYLRGVGIRDDGAERLAATRWAEQLTHLDLSRNSIGDRGARAVLASPHLKKLESLDLTGNIDSPRQVFDDGQEPISAETKRRLKARFGKKVV